MIKINSVGSSFEIYDDYKFLMSGSKDAFYVYLSQNTLIPVINISNGTKNFKFNLSQTNYVGKYDAMFDVADKIFSDFDKSQWGNSEIENINGYLTVNGDDRKPDAGGIDFPIMIGNQSDFYMESAPGNGTTGTSTGSVATLRSLRDETLKIKVGSSSFSEASNDILAYPPPGGTITRQETAKMVSIVNNPENNIQEDGKILIKTSTINKVPAVIPDPIEIGDALIDGNFGNGVMVQYAITAPPIGVPPTNPVFNAGAGRTFNIVDDAGDVTYSSTVTCVQGDIISFSLLSDTNIDAIYIRKA